MVPPFCICSMLDASCAVAIFRKSDENSWHVRVCLRSPHWQDTSIFSRQLVSGHWVFGWQGALQLWGHITRCFVQFCLQTSVSVSQAPPWQVLMHLCWPHFNGLLHGIPQLKSFWLHGIMLRCSWRPWQYLRVNAMQGGQFWAEWPVKKIEYKLTTWLKFPHCEILQLCVTSWSHGCWREHGLSHGGRLVPQGTGG